MESPRHTNPDPFANTGPALSCVALKPQPLVGTSCLSVPQGIGERLDPPEIKRRPGLAIRSECWSADDSCGHNAAKVVRCKRRIEMETLPCPPFEMDTRFLHVGDFWSCCFQRS